jgi:acyl carrier protein
MDIVQMNGFKTCVFAIDPIDANGNPVKAAAETSAAVAVVSKTLEALKKLFAKTYGVDEATLSGDTLLDDLKGPSVKFVGLVARLEDEFDAILSVTEASAAKTIGRLAKLIDGEDPDAADAAPVAEPVKGADAGSGEETETFKELRKMFAKTYKIDEASITPDTLLDSMEGPSVLFVGLVARLEDEFDAVISVTEASAAKTVGGLAKLVDEERE